MASKKNTNESKPKNMITSEAGLSLNVKEVEKYIKSQFNKDFGDNGPKISKSGQIALTACIEALIKMLHEDITVNVRENPKDGLRTIQQTHVTVSIGNNRARLYPLYVYTDLYTYDKETPHDKSLPVDVKDVMSVFEKDNNTQMSHSGKNYLCYLIGMFCNRVYNRVREIVKIDKKSNGEKSKQNAKSFTRDVVKKAIKMMDLHSSVELVMCNRIDEAVDRYNKYNNGDDEKEDTENIETNGKDEQEENENGTNKEDDEENEENEDNENEHEVKQKEKEKEKSPKKETVQKKKPVKKISKNESDEETQSKSGKTDSSKKKPESKRSSAGSKKTTQIFVDEDEEEEKEIKTASKSKSKK